MEYETSHFICHSPRKTNHLCSTTLVSQDAECNANSQPRHTGEIAQNCSACDKSFSFDFPFSHSLALLSWSLALYHLCLYLAIFFFASLYFTQSICHSFLSPSLLLSFSLFPFISLSHFLYFLSRRVTSLIRLTSFLSPFLTL